MPSLPLADERERAAQAAPPARRPLRARLSTGHLVMLLAGLVAMLLNYQLLRAGDAGTPVAVLVQDVAAGDVLASGHLRFVEVDAATDLLSTLVTADRAEAVRGQVARTDLPGGSVLRLGDLRPPAATGGQRAMSIPVAAEHAAAGRIEPGDRVDVIEVVGDRAAYLLVDAPVIDVASPDTRTGIAASRAFSVTVAIDAVDALHLALAIRDGNLEIVRSTGAPPPAVRHVDRAGAQATGDGTTAQATGDGTTDPATGAAGDPGGGAP